MANSWNVDNFQISEDNPDEHLEVSITEDWNGDRHTVQATISWFSEGDYTADYSIREAEEVVAAFQEAISAAKEAVQKTLNPG